CRARARPPPAERGVAPSAMKKRSPRRKNRRNQETAVTTKGTKNTKRIRNGNLLFLVPLVILVVHYSASFSLRLLRSGAVRACDPSSQPLRRARRGCRSRRTAPVRDWAGW